MKIAVGQSEFKLPERVRQVQFAIYSPGDPEQNPNAVLYMVGQVSTHIIAEMRKGSPDLRGMPAWFAVERRDDANYLIWYPAMSFETVGAVTVEK